MKWSTDSSGRRRIWYDASEIEAIMCGSVDAAGMENARVVDLERLAESHLRVHLDQHAELPNEVLGITEFCADGAVRVSINKDLTSEFESSSAGVSSIGRWRATLAHELSHVILHKELFVVGAQQSELFAETVQVDAQDERTVKCFKRDLQGQPSGSWKEVQANLGMAALLMPRRHFTMAFNEAMERYPDHQGDEPSRDLVESLALQFQASRQAVTIRLKTLALSSRRIPFQW